MKYRVLVPDGWNVLTPLDIAPASPFKNSYVFTNPKGDVTFTTSERKQAVIYACGLRDAIQIRGDVCPEHPEEHSNTCPTCSEWRLE